MTTWQYYAGKRPGLVHGSGSSTTDQEDEQSGFEFSEEIGLYLPETAAKEKRKKPIGFNRDA